MCKYKEIIFMMLNTFAIQPEMKILAVLKITELSFGVATLLSIWNFFSLFVVHNISSSEMG